MNIFFISFPMLMSTDSETAAENLAKIVTMDKKHRRAGYRQLKDVHKKRESMKKIAVDENLFKSNTLAGKTAEEEAEIAAAREKLQRLHKEAQKNDAEMEKLLETNKKKAELRQKHETYRERSIRKREAKKEKIRELTKNFWRVVKMILVVLGIICVIVGVTAILGCEYQMDGIKDLPICSFGKNPNNDDGDRRLLLHPHVYQDGMIEANHKYSNSVERLRGRKKSN